MYANIGRNRNEMGYKQTDKLYWHYTHIAECTVHKIKRNETKSGLTFAYKYASKLAKRSQANKHTDRYRDAGVVIKVASERKWGGGWGDGDSVSGHKWFMQT